MIARLSVYNRAAVISFPIISFVICSVSLVIFRSERSFSEAGRLAWSFGHQQGFPLIAFLGACIGLADWCFPHKKKILISSAVAVTALAGVFGWALAELIIEL